MPNKGHKQTEETKKKISNTMKGRTLPDEHKRNISVSKSGDKNPMFGKPLSEEHKRKISEAEKGKRNGENNPNWKFEKTDEERNHQRKYPEYYLWRKEVLERDNYICQKCGDNKGGNLEAHHIGGYTKNVDLRTTVSNGITLCETCHKDFHHQYGNESTTEKVNNFMSGRGYQKLNGETKL